MLKKTKDCRLKTEDYSKRGFTLIELLVTISIIAILATVAVSVYSTTQKSARISKRLQDLKAIQTAIETYKSANGYYPKVSSANACITDATNGLAKSLSPAPNFIPSYMPTMPTDPSGGTNCYKYQSDANGTEYKVWTFNTEMIDSEYAAQPQYIDPARDSGTYAADCTVTLTGTGHIAWAIFSSAGTASTNACAF